MVVDDVGGVGVGGDERLVIIIDCVIRFDNICGCGCCCDG